MGYLKNQKESFISYVRKIFLKTNISYLVIRKRTCAYQGVRNVSFLENFVYVLNEWSQTQTKSQLIQPSYSCMYLCIYFAINKKYLKYKQKKHRSVRD